MVKEARVVPSEPVAVKQEPIQDTDQKMTSSTVQPGKKRSQADNVPGVCQVSTGNLSESVQSSCTDSTSCKPCKSPKLTGLKYAPNNSDRSPAQAASPHPKSRLSRKRVSLGTPGKPKSPQKQNKEADCKVQ